MHRPTLVGAVRIPGTETLVRWPSRKTGLARVLLFLRLREREDPPPLELRLLSEPDPPRRRRQAIGGGGDHRELVALELSFRVEALRQTLEQAAQVPLGQHMGWWVAAIWAELAGACAVRDEWTGALEGPESPAVRARAATVTIDGCYDVDLERGRPTLPYRLYVRQDALEPIRRSLAENLSTELFLAMPQVLAEWALHGRPRGASARAQFLLPVLRTALFVAHELVNRALDDHRLQQRLVEILWDDPEGTKLLAVAETVPRGRLLREARIVLVDRTLRPAFRPAGVPPLCDRGRSADQLYAELLGTRDRPARIEFARHNPPTLARWFARLLGPEGYTARDFDLL